jgi:hypothetical protein
VKVRRIQLDKDYPVIRTWWEKRGVDAPQLVLLPQIGVMAETDEGPVACAFLYEDAGGKVGMVEWEATNPAVGSTSRVMQGLNMVFDFFEQFARERGNLVLLSWVAEDRGDGRLLERRKWVKCPGERHALMAFQVQQVEAPCPP